MSDNPARETPDARSFEERVFARFDSLDQRMTSFEGRLTSLEEKVDARLRETRPIWEAVLTRLDTVEADLQTVKTDMQIVKTDVESVKTDLKKLNRTVMLVHEDNLHIRGDLRDLLQGVEKLESERAR